MRQRRPSAKVNEHKDTRSFDLREDMEVSLELSFGIWEQKQDALKRAPTQANWGYNMGLKQKRPDRVGAQFSTGILYHEGNASQIGN